MGKRLKSGVNGNREGSGGGDSVDSGYDEYDEDYREVQLDYPQEIEVFYVQLMKIYKREEFYKTAH